MDLPSGSSAPQEIVEDALSRSGAVLDTLFEAAQDAIFLLEGMTLRDCNPATVRMFGCRTKAEIVGRTVLELSPVQQADGTASAKKAKRLVADASSGSSQHFDWRHRRLDGAELD